MIKRILRTLGCVVVPAGLLASALFFGYCHTLSNVDLTSISRTALPIIRQVTEFHASHGRYPTSKELRRLVNDPRLPLDNGDYLGDSIVYPGLHSPGSEQGWNYSAYKLGNGFELRNNYGFGRSQIIYENLNGNAQWLYQKQEDENTVPISLNP